MRDFRDAKAMARTLRQALAAKGVRLTNSEALELVAQQLGARDWNTLAAEIAVAEAPNSSPTAPTPAPAEATPRGREPPPGVGARGFVGFSSDLEATLHRAVAGANRRRHSYVSLEHLLQALIDDPDARAVLEACAVDLAALDWAVAKFIDTELGSLVREGPGETAAPTAGFQRVIQRAVIHVQSAGREFVTAANVLVAIFSERESHACGFLEQQGMTRLDGVNFIAHGIRKDGGRAA